MSYTAKYNTNTDVPSSRNTAIPLTYDGSTLRFTAETDDLTLLDSNSGVYPISVTAQLEWWLQTSYPSAPTATADATITFNDPCLTPFSFAATSQTGVSGSYDGVAIDAPLTNFTISPTSCGVTYTC